eukprot:scaffold1730_cov68-Phaeocystis_antarctica.AAC.6
MSRANEKRRSAKDSESSSHSSSHPCAVAAASEAYSFLIAWYFRFHERKSAPWQGGTATGGCPPCPSHDARGTGLKKSSRQDGWSHTAASRALRQPACQASNAASSVALICGCKRRPSPRASIRPSRLSVCTKDARAAHVSAELVSSQAGGNWPPRRWRRSASRSSTTKTRGSTASVAKRSMESRLACASA